MINNTFKSFKYINFDLKLKKKKKFLLKIDHYFYKIYDSNNNSVLVLYDDNLPLKRNLKNILNDSKYVQDNKLDLDLMFKEIINLYNEYLKKSEYKIKLIKKNLLEENKYINLKNVIDIFSVFDENFLIRFNITELNEKSEIKEIIFPQSFNIEILDTLKSTKKTKNITYNFNNNSSNIEYFLKNMFKYDKDRTLINANKIKLKKFEEFLNNKLTKNEINFNNINNVEIEVSLDYIINTVGIFEDKKYLNYYNYNNLIKEILNIHKQVDNLNIKIKKNDLIISTKDYKINMNTTLDKFSKTLEKILNRKDKVKAVLDSYLYMISECIIYENRKKEKIQLTISDIPDFIKNQIVNFKLKTKNIVLDF